MFVVAAGQRVEVGVLSGRGEDVRGRPEIVLAPGRVVAHGHEFDEADFYAQLVGEAQEIRQLRVVDAAQGHGVELDDEPGGQAGIDTAAYVQIMVAAGYGLESIPAKRVERNVYPLQPQIGQSGRQRGQENGVGGQPHVKAQGQQLLQKGQHALPDQRLATGQPDLAHAHAGQQSQQAVQLFVAQDIPVIQQRKVSILGME